MLESTAERVATSLDLEMAEGMSLAAAADSVLVEESPQGPRISITAADGSLLVTNADTVPARASARLPAAEIHRVAAVANSGAWIEVSVSDRAREGALRALALALLIAALPLLLLTFAISRWTVRRALLPLEDMTWRASAVSLEPGARTIGGAGGLAELERLRDAFDRLLARLGEQLRAERQFASDASHELRTPLTVLSGEIELALGDTGSAPATRAGLERAREQLRAMRDLIEALMLLRRAGEGELEAQREFEPVDLADTVEAARREAFEHHAGRAGDLVIMADLDVMVGGHPILLTAGVRNLLDNAFKFTAPGVAVHVAVKRDGDWAMLQVDDAGPGIAPENLERVFDPFFRGAEARAGGSGFGLGLPILRRVARAHGGDVTVESSPLGGARFTLRLPFWRSAALDSARVQADRRDSRRGGPGRDPRG